MATKSTPKKTKRNILKTLSLSSSQPILALAPMAGFTDLPFRLLCKKYGADLVFSEMVSAAGIAHQKKNSLLKTLSLVQSVEKEAPFFVQLFGENFKDFERAALFISSLEKNKKGKLPFLRRPEGIDLNFGCPVRKIIKQGAGCALMKDIKKSREIIKAVTQNTSLPVSIKIRAGIEKVNALYFLEKISDLDWKIVTIHARTFEQGFSGKPNWILVKKIKKLFPNKIVLANGAIFSPLEAQKVLKKTSADGVAFARGALEDPTIFRQTKLLLFSEKTPPEKFFFSKKSLLQKKLLAQKHLQLAFQFKKDQSFPAIKKQLLWYFRGLSFGKEFRKKISQAASLEELKKILT